MQRPPRGDQGKRYPQALNRINITEWCKKVTGKYSHNTDNQVVQSELIRGGNTIFKMLKRKDKQWFLNSPEQGDKPDFRGSTVSIKAIRNIKYITVPNNTGGAGKTSHHSSNTFALAPAPALSLSFLSFCQITHTHTHTQTHR